MGKRVWILKKEKPPYYLDDLKNTAPDPICFSCALKSRGRVLRPAITALSAKPFLFLPFSPSLKYPTQSHISVSEEFLMELPKQEADNKAPISTDDKSPKSDPKEEVQTPNGDGNWGNFVMGSENQTPTQNEQPVISTPSSGSKKTVRWSTELVTESPSVASNSYGSNSHASSAPSSSVSFKGIVSPSLIFGSVSLICICSFLWRTLSSYGYWWIKALNFFWCILIRDGGFGMDRVREMGEESRGSYKKGWGSGWKHLAAL